jgi:alpha-ketoglutarate-dependent 2,4-dichlorophenoxyacetate dioxygenase
MTSPNAHTGAANWPFDVTPLHPQFGCEISGLTLEEAASDTHFAAIYEAFLTYQLILFRDVDLEPATQVALAQRFGEVQVHVMNQYHGYDDHPEIYVLSNIDENGKPNGRHPDKGTLYWHTDGSWRPTPGLATMMYADRVPSAGGLTEFVDTYSAYERLPADWKARIKNLTAIHNLDFSRSRRHGEDPMTKAQRDAVPPVPHPVVRMHPESGRPALFLGDHAETIQGWDYQEGRDFIDELMSVAIPDDLVYAHQWSPRECAIWDNRCTLHRATSFDTANDIRLMRRCTTLGLTPN